MYLYFDRNGTLKEIINDEALRQGNYNVNRIYVYVDGLDYDSIDIRYLLPDETTLVGPQNHDTFTNPSALDNSDCYIPYNAKRDLRFFKYNQAYKFCVIDIEPDPGEETDTFGPSPLSQKGTVHCDLSLNLNNGGEPILGEVNFYVEKTATVDIGVVGSEKYLSLANYQYLRYLISNSNFVPYEGAVDDLDLGANAVKSGGATFTGSVWMDGGNILPKTKDTQNVGIFSRPFKQVVSNEFAVYPENYNSDTDTPTFYENGQIRTKGGYTLTFPAKSGTLAVTSDLPSQGVCATFSTSDFEVQAGGNYAISDVELSGFISGSNMLIITWDNCFALCPIPQSGAGRVCAAMWNANGESQIIRIKYELKSNNTLLDISLSGGFTPPSGHTAYVQCIKLFS